METRHQDVEHNLSCLVSATTQRTQANRTTPHNNIKMRATTTATHPSAPKKLPNSPPQTHNHKPSNISILPNPIQNLFYRLIMHIANIRLNLPVHFIGIRVYYIPSIETFIVEVFAYFGFVIDAGEECDADCAGWNNG
jgi:hypothetical protein